MIEVIQPFLAPAIMFSAGGLLCLAQFARYTAVLSVVRSLNRERLAVLEQVHAAGGRDPSLLAQRAQGLEIQAGVILSHARTVRGALRLLVGGILLMVACSLAIGASLALPILGHLALLLFILGLLATFAGLCLVLAELGKSMTQVEFEHENLSRFRGEGDRLLPPEPAPDEGHF